MSKMLQLDPSYFKNLKGGEKLKLICGWNDPKYREGDSFNFIGLSDSEMFGRIDVRHIKSGDLIKVVSYLRFHLDRKKKVG
jgi:hypothetical protein